MTFSDGANLDSPCTYIVGIDNVTAGLFLKDAFYLLNTQTMNLKYISDLPGKVNAATSTPEGDVYFASGTVLYKINTPKL